MLAALRLIIGFIKTCLIGVGLVVTLAIVALTFAVRNLAERYEAPAPAVEVSLAEPLILELRLSGEIAQRAPRLEDQLLRRMFDESAELYLPDIRRVLRRAAADERVRALHVELSSLSGDAASFSELRRALVEFEQSGKPLNVFIASADNLSYYLASAGDRVVLSPSGVIEVTGPVVTLVYFGEALRKLGVDLEVVKVGKYKSAFEPFLANEPSAPAREMYEALEASMRAHMVEAVAVSRGRAPEEVARWFKRSIYAAEAARDAGLVDGLGYCQKSISALRKEVCEDCERMSFDEYGKLSRDLDEPLAAGGSAGIALIEAVGEIDFSYGGRGDDRITPRRLNRELRWAQDNDDVKAVVLRIASPGGSATASDIIWREVKRLSAEKPVVVSMGDVAASGGYYIAAPATKIVAEPTTITGSIGVIAGIPSFAAFNEKYGVSFHVITQSDRAKMLDPGRRAGAADLAVLDETVRGFYKGFVQRVSDGRGIPFEQADALAQGRVYSGAQAAELGLVDRLGGLDTAADLAKELAGLDREKLYPILRYKGPEFDLARCLSGALGLVDCLRELDPSALVRAAAARPNAPLRYEAAVLELERAHRLLQRQPYLALWPGAVIH